MICQNRYFWAVRFIGVGILILVLLATTFSDALIYLAFKAQQERIADSLCININTPEVMCSGSCYLTEKLSEDKQTAGSRSSLVKENKPSLTLFLTTLPALALSILETSASSLQFSPDHFPLLDHGARLFRPPRC